MNDQSLQPRCLDEFIGQERVKENLRILIQAAKVRGEAIDHVLLYGPPGLGKKTLAMIISNEMGGQMRTTLGPTIERPGDLTASLTNLHAGDVLFIDEVHRLRRAVEQVLSPAMESFILDIVIGKGPSARSLRLPLPHFSLIGATTHYAKIPAPLRDRFGAVYRLDYYDQTAMQRIVRRSAGILNVSIDEDGVNEIARQARGTPFVANHLLKRVHDYARVYANGKVTYAVAREALSVLGANEPSAEEP